MSNETIQHIGLPDMSGEAQGKSPLIGRDFELIKNVEVQLTAIVGTKSLSVDQLFALKKGDVVALQQQLDEPIVFLVDGKPIACGQLVAVDDCFGVQITEIL